MTRTKQTFGFAILMALAVVISTAFGPAVALDTNAKQALIIDESTGAILLDKNSDERMPPSSMSKLMTVLMVFDRLADGTLNLDDTFHVSEKAWRKGGSKMFVLVDSKVRVEDLLRGIIIQSGNDACIVVAEALGGSEEGFAEMLNERAKQIGLTGSHFTNATGWPDPDHYVTARDLHTLAKYIIDTYPQYYHYFGESEFTYNKITQPNRNPLLDHGVGADGLKTGHTEAAGYGLVGSAQQDGRRVTLVVNGLDSIRQRSTESGRLMRWAFREFGSYKLFDAGQEVTRAKVWTGNAAEVPLVVDEDLAVTLKRSARRNMKVQAVFDEPVPSPIVKGDQLGVLKISARGQDPIEVPLVAGADVAKLGPIGRIRAAIQYMIFGASSE